MQQNSMSSLMWLLLLWVLLTGMLFSYYHYTDMFHYFHMESLSLQGNGLYQQQQQQTQQQQTHSKLNLRDHVVRDKAKKMTELLGALKETSQKINEKLHHFHVFNDPQQQAQLFSTTTTTSTTATNQDNESKPTSSSTTTTTTKLHVVTYATHGGRDDRFCRAMESAIMNNININILGWGQPWVGLSQKLIAAQQYALSLQQQQQQQGGGKEGEEDVMLFVDAFDVLFTPSGGNTLLLLERFRSLNVSLLFSAECGCWPHVMDDVNICLKQYPLPPFLSATTTTRAPYRYLNSGAWMGYAGAAAKMLEQVRISAGNNYANANDQKLVADLFLEQFKQTPRQQQQEESKRGFRIGLDYKTQIFQSMHMTLDAPLPFCDPTQHIQLDNNNNNNNDKEEEKLFANKITKVVPAVFHFNGGGKSVHLEYEKVAQHKQFLRPQQGQQQQQQEGGGEGERERVRKQQQRLAEAVVNMPDRKEGNLLFGNICQQYMHNEYHYPS